MKTYLIQIGNMNAQNNYKVKANSEKSAKEIAIKHHKKLGRNLEDKKVFVTRVY